MERIEYYDKAGQLLKTRDATEWKLMHGRFWRIACARDQEPPNQEAHGPQDGEAVREPLALHEFPNRQEARESDRGPLYHARTRRLSPSPMRPVATPLLSTIPLLLLGVSLQAQDLDDLLDELAGETGAAEDESPLRSWRGFVELRPRVYLHERDKGQRNDEQLLMEAELELEFRFTDEITAYARPRVLVDALDGDLKRFEPYEAYATFEQSDWDLRGRTVRRELGHRRHLQPDRHRESARLSDGLPRPRPPRRAGSARAPLLRGG